MLRVSSLKKEKTMPPVPPRAAMPQRPVLQAPQNVVPQQPANPVAPANAPIAATTPANPPVNQNVATTPTQPVNAPVAPQGTAPSAPVAATKPEKKKRGRQARNLTAWWGLFQYSDQGEAIVDKDGNPVKRQLSAPPALYAGTRDETEKGGKVKQADGSEIDDTGFNQLLNEPLVRKDFDKTSTFLRHKANLHTQQAGWLNAEAAEFDSGKRKSRQAGTRQVDDMRNAMAEVLALLQSQGVSTDGLLSKLSPDTAKLLAPASTPAAPAA